jgi:hypothetical protein
VNRVLREEMENFKPEEEEEEVPSMDAEPEMGEPAPEMGDEMGMGEPGLDPQAPATEATIEDVMVAVADAIQDVTGIDVNVENEAPEGIEEPEMGGDTGGEEPVPEMGDDMGGEEPAPEMGDDEEEENPFPMNEEMMKKLTESVIAKIKANAKKAK